MIAQGIKITVACILIVVFLAVFLLLFYFFFQFEFQYKKRKIARRKARRAQKTLNSDAPNDIRTDDSTAKTNGGTVSGENAESMKRNAEQAGRRPEEEQKDGRDEPWKSINLREFKFKFGAREKALISAEVKAGSANGNEINRRKSDARRGSNASNTIRNGAQSKETEKGSSGVSKLEKQSDDKNGVQTLPKGVEKRKSLNLKSIRSARSLKSLKSSVDYTQPPKFPENLLSKRVSKLGKRVDHRSPFFSFLSGQGFWPRSV